MSSQRQRKNSFFSPKNMLHVKHNSSFCLSLTESAPPLCSRHNAPRFFNIRTFSTREIRRFFPIVKEYRHMQRYSTLLERFHITAMQCCNVATSFTDVILLRVSFRCVSDIANLSDRTFNRKNRERKEPFSNAKSRVFLSSTHTNGKSRGVLPLLVALSARLPPKHNAYTPLHIPFP